MKELHGSADPKSIMVINESIRLYSVPQIPLLLGRILLDYAYRIIGKL